METSDRQPDPASDDVAVDASGPTAVVALGDRQRATVATAITILSIVIILSAAAALLSRLEPQADD